MPHCSAYKWYCQEFWSECCSLFLESILGRKIIFSRSQELRGKNGINQLTSWPTGSQAKEASFPMTSVSSASWSASQLPTATSPPWQEGPYAWPGQRCRLHGRGLSPLCTGLVRTWKLLRPLPFCKMELKTGGERANRWQANIRKIRWCCNLISLRNCVFLCVVGIFRDGMFHLFLKASRKMHRNDHREVAPCFLWVNSQEAIPDCHIPQNT